MRSCYDWGTFGWLLMHSGHVEYKRYRYFFFINSSVRGPFMPPYARVRGPNHARTAAQFLHMQRVPMRVSRL